MKNLFIFLTLLLSSPLFSQVDFRIEYYPAVNRAEMAITKDDYQTAFTEYQTAFAAVKTPLARDIFNAVACKFLLNDFEGAKPLLLKLAKKGISISSLEEKEVFRLENIKSQWNSFKFLYEQIQSMQQEQVSSDLLQKIEMFDSAYDSLRANSIVVFVDESGKERLLISKDIQKKKTNGGLSTEDAKTKNLMNGHVSNELFNKAQKALVDFVVDYGFLSEENMFVEDSDFLRNGYAWSIEKYKFRMSFQMNGGYSRDVKPFSTISDGKKKQFDSSIVESVKLGRIHRDLALKLLLGYKTDNKLFFTKITIENIENCSLDLKEKTYSLFYYKKSGQNLDTESQQAVEALVLGDYDLLLDIILC